MAANAVEEDGYDVLYKYGCTTKTPEARCKRVNATCDYAKFKVIASFKSFDIFNDESSVGNNILWAGIGNLGEIFPPAHGESEEVILRRFLIIGGVLPKASLYDDLWEPEG